jgi:16S rRNA (guanine527-N7)-methyltransferase
MRAVDKMELAVQRAGRLVRPGGWLALMTTESQFSTLKEAAGPEFSWADSSQGAGDQKRLLALGERKLSLPA